MATIFELTEYFRTIQNLIEEGAENLEDTLESIEMAIEDKVEGYSMVIRNIESDVDGLDKEIKRLTERKKMLENGIDRMKKNLQFALAATGKRKVQTEKFTVSLRKSTSVRIVDESKIPEEFFKVKTERTISKKELAQRLKEQEIDGAELVENESLQIR